MIPIHLRLSGFLSYRDPVELDFTGFDLACISGANGAGKSSLLDAITWVLFGQARKHDDSLINSHPEVEAAEVVFTFGYEGNLYRVQRANPRGETPCWSFTSPRTTPARAPSSIWMVWPGNSSPGTACRATQATVEETLRMDYDTFVNASFFLQGKADQFTQQRPGDRKRILGSILGLEIWESYRQRAAEQRKGVEAQMAALDGRLAEINAELAEEKTRQARLSELEKELERLAAARRAQATALESIRKLVATLNEQRRWVNSLAQQAQAAGRQVETLAGRQQARQGEQATLQATLAPRGANRSRLPGLAGGSKAAGTLGGSRRTLPRAGKAPPGAAGGNQRRRGAPGAGAHATGSPAARGRCPYGTVAHPAGSVGAGTSGICPRRRKAGRARKTTAPSWIRPTSAMQKPRRKTRA